jgi:hypothetical protein
MHEVTQFDLRRVAKKKAAWEMPSICPPQKANPAFCLGITCWIRMAASIAYGCSDVSDCWAAR